MSLTYNFRTVAMSGKPAPGCAGANYGDFAALLELGGLSASGDVAFVDTLTGTGVDPSNNAGIWQSSASGETQLIIRAGNETPGLRPTGRITGLIAPTFRPDGAVVFPAYYDGPAASVPGTQRGAGVWSAGEGRIEPLLSTGRQAPGFPSGTRFSIPKYGNPFSYPFPTLQGGEMIFQSSVGGTSLPFIDSVGVWRGTAESLRLVFRSDHVAPSLPPGIEGVGYISGPFVTAVGGLPWMTFSTNISESGNPAGIALFAGPLDRLSVLARSGQTAPGTNAPFSNLTFVPTLNASGRAAFLGSTSTLWGIWAGTPQHLELIALEGQSAAGLPGFIFNDFSDPLILDSGEVLFSAMATRGAETRQGAWVWLPHCGLAPLVVAGQQAPGGGGATFTLGPQSQAVDGAGRLTYTTTLSSGAEGIWVSHLNDPPRPPELVLLSGQSIKAGGRTRTVAYMNLWGGILTSTNNAGQILLMIVFDDRSSGVFVASPNV